MSYGRAVVAILICFGSAAADTPVPPPTRSYSDPGAPPFTVAAPTRADGNFVIGPDYPAPSIAEAPEGKLQQFTMDSRDSHFYPGVGRDVFGTVDPDNPQT